MTETLLLSRYKLETFLICQRRFQLRFRRQLPWPDRPLSGDGAEAQERGEQFHQLLERHFLGLPVAAEAIQDVEVRRWWSLIQRSLIQRSPFQRHGQLPEGERHPERSLTVPIGGHVLNGRFDLLIFSPDSAHIFDWKTGRPRDEADLRQDWQTRLYLAMLAEGGPALGHTLRPDQIALTYWYVNDPAAPRTIRYSQAWHKENWADIQALVAQIDQALAKDDWPLTDDWSHCRRCAYQVYCDRQAAGPPLWPERDELDETTEPSLEPEIP